MNRDPLTKKYRPKRFEDVQGQEHPVSVLSGLIRRGQIRRDLLLFGSVGSGKTSLVRLYAKALNCASPDPNTGSPCGKCSFCTDVEKHIWLAEYDVSGLGGKKTDIQNFLQAHRYSGAVRGKTMVYFFDEAHSLETDAADSLLKRIEDRDEDEVFCFATTEVERIRPALQSRLMLLEVRPLAADTAIAWLRKIAAAESIKIEDDALRLLAGIRHGYPRDLVGALEQLRGLGYPQITLDLVRTSFNLEHLSALPEYFLALAAGDLKQQLAVFAKWREPGADKVGWIQAFLTSLYYNEVSGIRLSVNAAVDAISPSERRNIVDRWCEKLALEAPQHLAPFWRQMMSFWRFPASELDESALQLKIALFNDFVADAQARLKDHEQQGPSQRFVSGSAVISSALGFLPRDPINPALDRPASELEPIPDPRYLRADDVRSIVNRASFLGQHYGVLFNAAFKIVPSFVGASSEEECLALFDDFCDALSERFGSLGNSQDKFAYLRVAEGEGGSARGYVVAHLPSESGHADDLDFTPAYPLESWLAAWEGRNAVTKGFKIKLRRAPQARRQALAFHWEQALNLCASLDPKVLDYDPNTREWEPLYKLLRLPKTTLRTAGPIDGLLIRASSLLQDQAISEASEFRLEPLSAFDTRAWGHIRSGWELDEYSDRREVLKRRKSEIRELTAALAEGTSEFEQAVTELASSWPDDPKLRERSWTGWWAQ